MPYPSLPPSLPSSPALPLSPEETTIIHAAVAAASSATQAAAEPPLASHGEAKGPETPVILPATASTGASLLGPPLSTSLEVTVPGVPTPLSPDPATAQAAPVEPAVSNSPQVSRQEALGSASKPLGPITSQASPSKPLPQPVRQVLTTMGAAIVDSGLTTSVRLAAQPSGGDRLTFEQLELVAQNPPPQTADPLGDPLELRADRQEYNDQTQVFTAEGNVVLRFRGAELRADRLQASLQERTAIASGNITLTRGQQVLMGEQLTYNFAQEQGTFRQASGSIFLPALEQDFSPTVSPVVLQPLPNQLQGNQPDSVRTTGTDIQRLRFQAEQIDFGPQGWVAQEIRITNDPFSPPELELRAERATLRRISRVEDRVNATRPRLVFDQALSIPILKSEVTLSRGERDPLIAELGYDENDRGGLFVGRNFELIETDQTSFTVTPQFFIQRAIRQANFNLIDPDVYGVKAQFRSRLGPQTRARGFAALTSFDPTDLSDNLRIDARLQRDVGIHQLGLRYAYRDRVYNGSLGEQTIQSRFGLTFSSPAQVALADTGIIANYQASSEYITARTDRPEFGGSASLGRFRASAELKRGFYLWQSQPLPPTANAGLRYTPVPVVPYLQLVTGIKGISSNYSNGDNQQTLIGTLGLQGQIGRFSRPYLDYTGFNISYSQVGQLGSSPFLFDRIVDFKTLSAGILQQVYGPLRIGAQTSFNLDTGQPFNTDVILDYSRRTYGVTLRYSPTRETGSVSFRINSFNWESSADTFPAAAPFEN